MTALAYLPELLPDESFYSFFARYRHHLHLPHYRACKHIFGRYLTVPPSALQSHLGEVSNALRGAQGLTPDVLLHQTTPYNYYVAFANPRTARIAKAELISPSGTSVPTILGLTRAPLSNRVLRLCMECCTAADEKYADVYWRRAHQLPGVLLCPDHGSVLMNTEVSLSVSHGTPAVAAETALNGPLVPALTEAQAHLAEDILLEIAQRSARLCLHSPVPIKHIKHKARYREQLLLLLAAPTQGRGLRQAQVAERLSEFLAPIADILPALAPHRAGPLANMFWHLRDRSIHPLRHILFQMFLERSVAVDPPAWSREKRFGDGPWPCLNPLSDHFQRNIITSFSMMPPPRGGGGDFARFSCLQCSFSYRRKNTSSGPLRVLGRGPLFDEMLRNLAPTQSASELARRLGAHHSVIIDYAARHGIAIRGEMRKPPPPRRVGLPKRHLEEARSMWLSLRMAKPTATRSQLRKTNNRLYLHLQQVDRLWLDMNAPRRASVARDWQTIDRDFAQKVEHLGRDLLSRAPPTRVSSKILMRTLGRPSWARLYALAKMPLTAEVLSLLHETIAAFQFRRAVWAISQLEAEGSEVVVREVARRAGIDRDFTRYIAERAVAEWKVGHPGCNHL